MELPLRLLSGRFFSIPSTDRGPLKTFTGGYKGPIHLRADASRTSSVEPPPAVKGCRTASNRDSL